LHGFYLSVSITNQGKRFASASADCGQALRHGDGFVEGYAKIFGDVALLALSFSPKEAFAVAFFKSLTRQQEK